MSLIIIKKQMKEFFYNKANLIYIGVLVIICGIVIPIFYQDTFFTLAPILCLSFITQIAPGVFVGEKENRTLETLLTFPVPMKQIFLSKAAYCTVICCGILWVSFLLGMLSTPFFIRTQNPFWNWENIIVIFLLAPMIVWNLSYHASLHSLRSNDARACALKLILLAIPYSIPFVTLFAAIKTGLSEIQNGVVWGIYILLNVAVFVLLRIGTSKYLDKVMIFGTFRN